MASKCATENQINRKCEDVRKHLQRQENIEEAICWGSEEYCTVYSARDSSSNNEVPINPVSRYSSRN